MTGSGERRAPARYRPPPVFRSLADRLRSPRALPWLAALAATLAAMAWNVGRLPPDPHTRYLVAESLVRDGDLEIEPSLLTVQQPAGDTGPDARTFSVFQPGQSVVFLPVAAAAELGRRVLGGPDAVWTDGGSFAASMLLIAPLAGLLVLGHVRLLQDLGLSVRAATASGLVLAFGTAHWVWAPAGSEEIVLGACGVWAWCLGRRGVAALQRADERADGPPDAPDHEAATGPADATAAPRRAARLLGLAGVLLAAGLCHRLTFGSVVLGWLVLVLPPLAGALARAPQGAPRAAAAIALRLLPWFLAACAIVALVPIYNHLRFGDALDTGYARYYAPFGGLWATPLLEGLGGLVLSPGKSLFVHSPWLLLALPAVASARVRRTLASVGPMTLALAVATLLHLVVYAKTTFWAGGLGFGVRFHVSLMPLWLVPIAVWTAGWWPRRDEAVSTARRLGAAAVIALALPSAGVQVVGLALNTGYAYLADPAGYDELDGRIPRAAAWDAGRAPILIRTRAIARKLAGEDILPEGEPESKRLQASWNVFPVRASVVMPGRPGLLRLLWAAWAGLMLAWVLSLALAIRAWRGAGGTVRSAG